MKRRKRWIIALSLTLLFACMVIWKWSERPPYKFMSGAELYFADHLYYNPGFSASPEVQAIYIFFFRRRSKSPIDEAKRELAGAVETPLLTFNGVRMRSLEWRAPDGVTVTVSEFDPGQNPVAASIRFRYPPWPQDVTGQVVIWRKASVIDKSRVWLYHLRYRGHRMP